MFKYRPFFYFALGNETLKTLDETGVPAVVLEIKSVKVRSNWRGKFSASDVSKLLPALVSGQPKLHPNIGMWIQGNGEVSDLPTKQVEAMNKRRFGYIDIRMWLLDYGPVFIRKIIRQRENRNVTVVV